MQKITVLTKNQRELTYTNIYYTMHHITRSAWFNDFRQKDIAQQRIEVLKNLIEWCFLYIII